MVKAEFPSEYLNAKSAKDGEIAEIIGEGAYREADFSGKKKRVFDIPVKYDNHNMIYTPSSTMGRKLVEVWGEESLNWIGKKMQTFVIEGNLIVKPLI